ANLPRGVGLDVPGGMLRWPAHEEQDDTAFRPSPTGSGCRPGIEQLRQGEAKRGEAADAEQFPTGTGQTHHCLLAVGVQELSRSNRGWRKFWQAGGWASPAISHLGYSTLKEGMMVLFSFLLPQN